MVDRLRTPPQVTGWPVLGNAWEYFRYPEPLLRRGYRELGPIFSLRLGPRRAVVLIGPDYHRFFFHETDHCLSVAATFQWIRPIFGHRFLLAVEGRPHLTDKLVLHRRLKGQGSSITRRILSNRPNAGWTGWVFAASSS